MFYFEFIVWFVHEGLFAHLPLQAPNSIHIVVTLCYERVDISSEGIFNATSISIQMQFIGEDFTVCLAGR